LIFFDDTIRYDISILKTIYQYFRYIESSLPYILQLQIYETMILIALYCKNLAVCLNTADLKFFMFRHRRLPQINCMAQKFFYVSSLKLVTVHALQISSGHKNGGLR